MAATTTPSSDLESFLGADPAIERLYDNVLVSAPAVTLAAVKMQAWNAIEGFYLRSTSRRESVFWQMAPGIATIDFNPFDANWLVGWILDVSGLARPKIEMPSTLRDLDSPTQLRKGEALLALKPVSLDADLDGTLWIQWFDTILSGTLARLFAQPAKPYSSPQLAVFHAKQYRAGVSQARDIAQRQYTNGPGRWNYPYFASGKRKQ